MASEIKTNAVGSVTWNSIIGNGELVDSGSSGVTEGGICYKTGTSGDPTTSDSKSTVYIPGVVATGGTVTYTDSSGLNPRSSPAYSGGYKVHTFTTVGSNNFTVTQGGSIEYLMVAGGGGGGSGDSAAGGGGGAGGFLSGTKTASVQSYTITVGNGGSSNATGGNSIFDDLTAYGGGDGGRNGRRAGAAGGSGGGAYGYPLNTNLGGHATPSDQGKDGGDYGYTDSASYTVCAGGGGAGAVGANGTSSAGGNGGIGVSSSISGTSKYYAGGGGGGKSNGGTQGTGGTGGGGDGGGDSGDANTGGGGGGATSGGGGSGGTGIVIVRYPSDHFMSVGEFNVAITGLTKNTSYRLRAYAINTEGTFYGDSITQATPIRTVGNVSRILEIDYMEYATDALAQAAYVSNSSANLQVTSEATIKTQGDYSLKGVATITGSLNKTLTRTLTGVENIINIPYCTSLSFAIRASRTGSNIKIGLHDSGGTTTEITPNITSADTWQTVVWDISAVANTNKDSIDSIIITIINADAGNTFYIDNFIVVGSSASNIFGWIM